MAVEYARGNESTTLLKLIRTIGLLLLILGGSSLLTYPTAFFGGAPPLRWLPQPRAERILYVISVLISYSGGFSVSVLSIWAGILCLRSPLRGRRVILAWAYASLAITAYSTLYFSFYLVGSRTSTYRGLINFALQAQRSAPIAVFPFLCALFFHLADVRRLFVQRTSQSALHKLPADGMVMLDARA